MDFGTTNQLDYQPSNLLDTLITILGLKNDAALSRVLEIGSPIISKVRHSRLPISSAVLLRMHEVSDLSIGDLRRLMGDRRKAHRASTAYGRWKFGAADSSLQA